MMQRPQIMTGVAVVLTVIIGAWVAMAMRETKPKTVTLIFHAEMDDSPLVFDQFVYENPGGEGTFRIRDFRFYVSNLSLSGGNEIYAEPDSYHLLRFDNADGSHSVTVPDVPIRAVDGLQFLIGVDPSANSSIEVRGDLDPNSQMAWNWEVGYKFVVFEGALQVGDVVSPLVYHVGFSENAREVSFTLPAEVSEDANPEIHLNVDLSQLFSGPYDIDMQKLPSVKFDRDDARMLADNYTQMISLKK